MTKKDINFIKHIKPKLKDKEVLQGKNTNTKRYRKAVEHAIGDFPANAELIAKPLVQRIFDKWLGGKK